MSPIETREIGRSADPDLYAFGSDGSVTILGSRSDGTGDLFWPTRLRCPITGGTVSAVELSTVGTIWTWTFVHAPWRGVVLPGPEHGYAAGLVDLDEGGPRLAVILFGGLDTWQVGDRARARALPLESGPDGPVSLLAFERIDA